MDFERKTEENDKQYGMRLYKNKSLYGLSNDDIGEILNVEFNVKFDESAHRKKFVSYIEGYDDAYEQYLSDSKGKKVFNSLMPKTHIDKYRELVTDYDVKKRSMQKERMQLAKYVKELAPAVALADDYKFLLAENNYTIDIPNYCYEPIIDLSDNKIIVHLTDFHIGYVIDNCKGNYFNWKIANKRIDKLIREIKKKMVLYNVNHVYLANTGDMVEHVYMRNNQSQFCEFGLLEQANKASEIISKIIVSIAELGIIEYKSLSGNHDRGAGDKKMSLKGDNVNVIVNKQIQTHMELASLKNEELERIIIHDYDEMQDEFFFEINGGLHKFIHGDGKKGSPSQLIKSEMSMDDMQYCLWKGHLHNFNIVSENNGRYVISSGCLSGFNDYSVNFGCATLASQTIAVINKDGEFEEIRDVLLQ